MNEEEFMEEVIGRYVEKNTTHIKGYTKEYVDNLLQEKDKEIERLKRENKIMKKYFQMIIDIGFDYDGYNESESLKKLIDELVKYASYGRDADDTKVMYVNKEENYNILMEKIGDDKE